MNATTLTKWQPYPAYKDSGVEWLGEIPKHWALLPVKAITERKHETNQPDLPLLSVYRDYGVILKDSRDDNYNKPALDLSPYRVVRPTDLVLNKMKTWQGSLAVSTLEGIVSPAYVVCKLSPDVHPRYIHHLLRSEVYIAQYASLSYGIRPAQWEMRYGDFRLVSVLILPLEEQRAIANFLDRKTAEIDVLIAKKERLIELLQEKRTALISHAVTKGIDSTVKMKDSGVGWLGVIQR